MIAPPAPGLYIHVPFCRAKCPYCDFASAPADRGVREAYLGALAEELARRGAGVAGPFRTVYVGGGSPSSLEDDEWQKLVATAAAAGGAAVECTFEMNPDQVSAEKLGAIAGVATRVSVGAQTFEPHLREALGRQPRDPGCIARAVDLVRGRFDCNLDLMHSLPGQTLAELERDLARIAELAPDHVSAYALTIERGTPLAARIAAGALALPDEEFQAQALEIVRARLAAVGFGQYEISNFARPGKECLHNQATWAGCDYLGVGAAACSYLEGERTRNEPDARRYVASIRDRGHAVVERERLRPRARAGELAMLRLRTRAGIPLAAFRAATGFDAPALFAAAIAAHGAAGLLERTETHLRLTERGLDLADAVIADFVDP
jgi:oxygen-independent coproporphyrinogen-3 oxidase